MPRPVAGMTRVLQLFEPPDGGVPQAVEHLADGLPGTGLEVEVAGPPGSPALGRMAARGVAVHELPLSRRYDRPDRDLRALAALTALLRSGDYALLHAHSAKAGFLGRLAARAAGVPALYSPQCLPFVGEVSERRRRLSIAAERGLGPLTAAMLCACEAERQLALQHRLLAPERLEVVRNGADAAAGEPADPRLLELRGDGVLAGAVAVLRPQKGLNDLLRAAPRVLAASPQARIAIVGDGPERAALELQAAALGLDREPRFALLSYEGPPERHLAALDVFVLPSLWEALPFAALEAMACGVPQVVTDVGGSAEAVTADTGRVVAPHDPDAVAATLIELLGDAGLRAAMSAASLARHREAFTAQRMVDETAAAYRRVLGLSAAASTVGAHPATA
jgi:glycosyltransferase involved in cell wall biosynthesis